jgi:hypothetical protein
MTNPGGHRNRAWLGAGLLLLAGLGGCVQWGVDPLVLDTSMTTSGLRVDQTAMMVMAYDSVDLQMIHKSSSEGVDSVRFYNLTITIDSTEGTPPGTSLTGTIGIVSGGTIHVLAQLNNVPITGFSMERSIFDRSLSGMNVDYSGVGFLIGAMSMPAPPKVGFGMVASSSNSPLHFTVKVNLYAQVFTSPFH